MGQNLYDYLHKIPIRKLLNLWHDSIHLGFDELFNILPLIINDKLRIHQLLQKIENNENLNIELNDDDHLNLDFNDLFTETDQFLISNRASKTKQVYVNNAKLTSKTSTNIANSIKSSLNAIDAELLQIIQSSNKDQASNENSAIKLTFNLTKKTENLFETSDARNIL